MLKKCLNWARQPKFGQVHFFLAFYSEISCQKIFVMKIPGRAKNFKITASGVIERVKLHKTLKPCLTIIWRNFNLKDEMSGNDYKLPNQIWINFTNFYQMSRILETAYSVQLVYEEADNSQEVVTLENYEAGRDMQVMSQEEDVVRPINSDN